MYEESIISANNLETLKNEYRKLQLKLESESKEVKRLNAEISWMNKLQSERNINNRNQKLAEEKKLAVEKLSFKIKQVRKTIMNLIALNIFPIYTGKDH